MSTVVPRVNRTSSGGDTIARWRSDPAPTQTTGAREDRSLDEDGYAGGRREGSDRTRGEPRRSEDFGRTCDARLRAAGRACDLLRVGSTVPGDERKHRPLLAHEDERLDDLVESATDRLGHGLRSGRVGGELLQTRLGACGAEEDGDALDGLGPGHRPIVGAHALERRRARASRHREPVGL